MWGETKSKLEVIAQNLQFPSSRKNESQTYKISDMILATSSPDQEGQENQKDQNESNAKERKERNMIQDAITMIKEGKTEEAVEILEGLAKQTKAEYFTCAREIAEKYKWMGNLSQEEVILLCLNRDSKIIKEVRLSKGTSTYAPLKSRDVFRESLRVDATGIVLIHNHPRGNPHPSSQDRTTTDGVIYAGKIFDIELADHIIIAHDGYYSFKEKEELRREGDARAIYQNFPNMLKRGEHRLV